MSTDVRPASERSGASHTLEHGINDPQVLVIPLAPRCPIKAQMHDPASIGASPDGSTRTYSTRCKSDSTEHRGLREYDAGPSSIRSARSRHGWGRRTRLTGNDAAGEYRRRVCTYAQRNLKRAMQVVGIARHSCEAVRGPGSLTLRMPGILMVIPESLSLKSPSPRHN